MVGEVFEDDEGAGGFEKIVERRLGDAATGGEESSVDWVSGDLVEDWARSGVDGDLIGDLGEEVCVGWCFGFVDEDGVEWIGGVDVVFEDE